MLLSFGGRLGGLRGGEDLNKMQPSKTPKSGLDPGKCSKYGPLDRHGGLNSKANGNDLTRSMALKHTVCPTSQSKGTLMSGLGHSFEVHIYLVIIFQTYSPLLLFPSVSILQW